MTALGQEDKWVEKEWSLGERFGANVVWLRRQAGLTQTQLADRIGMTRTLLSHIERGRRLPRLDTILKLVAALKVKNCDLVTWMCWDPASHRHYETPPSIADISGYEVRDFHLPAGFRVSPVGYESEERFRDRLRQRREDPDYRAVLELLRDDAPKVAPRERPDAVWVLFTGQALEALREERGLTRQELADRSPTTAAFIKEIEEGRCDDPGLQILEELCRALNGEGSVLAAQIDPVRAARKAAVKKALDELAERDARQPRSSGEMPPRSSEPQPLNSSSLLISLGSAAKAIRGEANLTQVQLGERSGLHPTYISQIECGAGNPSWTTLSRLCEGLGVPRWVLIKRVDDLGGR